MHTPPSNYLKKLIYRSNPSWGARKLQRKTFISLIYFVSRQLCGGLDRLANPARPSFDISCFSPKSCPRWKSKRQICILGGYMVDTKARGHTERRRSLSGLRRIGALSREPFLSPFTLQRQRHKENSKNDAYSTETKNQLWQRSQR